MVKSNWLYSKGDDHQQGPVSTKELARLATTGALRPDDLVWKEGMDEWLPGSRVNGLNFPSTSRLPTEKRFDPESLQATFRGAQQKANEAAGALWFLDLKFNRFVAATIIRIVWCVHLVLVALALASVLIGTILTRPIIQALFASLAAVLVFAFLTLMFRLCLEVFMVMFRMAEHLREMNEKLASR